MFEQADPNRQLFEEYSQQQQEPQVNYWDLEKLSLSWSKHLRINEDIKEEAKFKVQASISKENPMLILIYAANTLR